MAAQVHGCVAAWMVRLAMQVTWHSAKLLSTDRNFQSSEGTPWSIRGLAITLDGRRLFLFFFRRQCAWWASPVLLWGTGLYATGRPMFMAPDAQDGA